MSETEYEYGRVFEAGLWRERFGSEVEANARLRSDLEGARALASKLADALEPMLRHDWTFGQDAAARAALSEARGMMGKEE